MNAIQTEYEAPNYLCRSPGVVRAFTSDESNAYKWTLVLDHHVALEDHRKAATDLLDNYFADWDKACVLVSAPVNPEGVKKWVHIVALKTELAGGAE